MNIHGQVEVGDLIGHPSWHGKEYECTRVEATRFYVRMEPHIGDIAFPYYNEFFIVSKKKPRQKSGFGKWISAQEHRESQSDGAKHV